MFCMWCVSALEICCASCFVSNKTIYGCDATVLLNVYIYLFSSSSLGEGYLKPAHSHLPHRGELYLLECANVCNRHVEELVAAAPELKVVYPKCMILLEQ
jgi:hypothetical protein